MINHDKKFPRYTSYPPITRWKGVSYQLSAISCQSTASIYIHLPFCRKRCAFCACNAIATTKIGITNEYVDMLIKEMCLVFGHMLEKPAVSSIHFGGGTPTYLDTKQLSKLITKISDKCKIYPNAEIAIEAEPSQTTVKKMDELRGLGFNRISFGLQDTNPLVLKSCGRETNYPHIKSLIDEARKVEFKGINIDLCYGLPHQNLSTFSQTIDDVTSLSPDRIALFSFAYLPEIQENQRSIDPSTLPTPKQKFEIFAMAVERFGRAGYNFIGLDHFAKKDDELSMAYKKGKLRRTFQGYVANDVVTTIGFGVTAISSYPEIYVQNERKLSDYMRRVRAGELPVARGHMLSEDDLIRGWVMQKIFCQQEIDKMEFRKTWGIEFDGYFDNVDLNKLIIDGLITSRDAEIQVTKTGRFFLQAIAAAFDIYSRSSRQ